MSGLRFKSSKKLPADSPYRRLVAAALPSSESCWPNKPLSLGHFGTIGCSSVQHSLVLSGLEEAVSAARETSEVIKHAWAARTDVQRANIEASAPAVRQVQHAWLLAESLRECSLRRLVEAEYAQLSRLRGEEVRRLLD